MLCLVGGFYGVSYERLFECGWWFGFWGELGG